MEDARFVRFTDGEDLTYYATYTAFDGSGVASHLLETTDFRTFTVSPLAGPATQNKGMALFPRRIRGRYAALSRWTGRATRSRTQQTAIAGARPSPSTRQSAPGS